MHIYMIIYVHDQMYIGGQQHTIVDFLEKVI